MKNEYELVIEFEEFITRRELNYILLSLDRIIEQQLFPNIYYSRPSPRGPVFTYLGITGASAGSIILGLGTGKKIFKYASRRIGRGFERGQFGNELERTGEIVSNAFGGILGKLNDWAEKYVGSAKKKGSHIRGIVVRKKKM